MARLEAMRRYSARTTVLVVAGVLALNVLGVLRYPGGPLRESNADGILWLDLRPTDQGSNVYWSGPADWSQVGKPIYFGAAEIANAWPMAVTVESISAVDPTPGLVIDHVWIGRPGHPPAAGFSMYPKPYLPDGVTYDEMYSPVPAALPGSGTADAGQPIVLQFHGEVAGDAGFAALAVDYRVGPFAFRVIQHVVISVCLGPLPPGQACSAP